MDFSMITIDSKKVNSIKAPEIKRRPTSYKDLNKDDVGNLIALSFNSKAYHSQLNLLPKDLRAFVYKNIEADDYYLVFDENSGIIIGGFATKCDGELNGLFSLVKGIGKKLFKLRLEYALKNVDKKHSYLSIFCIGDKLKSLYSDFGFKVTETIKWNDYLAPDNWNYERFGTQDLYIMRKEIN